MTNGVHAVDLFRFLFGEVRNVSARIATFIQDIEVEDTAGVLVEMENGALGTTDLSWSIPIPQDLYLEIYGSKGFIMVGLNDVRYQAERSKTCLLLVLIVSKNNREFQSIFSNYPIPIIFQVKSRPLKGANQSFLTLF